MERNRDFVYLNRFTWDSAKHIGNIDGRVIATVITTDRDTNGGALIRLISARQATSKEVNDYEQNAKRIQGY